MTAHKHFKARVRDRMRKTGESYSTARMHLTSTRDVPVAGLVPGYPGLQPITQYDAGLWQRILAQAGTTDPASGLPFTEAYLAGLAGGIGFMVFTFEYESVTTATVVTRFHPGPYVDNLSGRTGAQVDVRTTTSARLASAHLDADLQQGRAVAVRVTRAALPWFPDLPEYSDSVDVVVAGHDGESYLIDDGGTAFRRVSPPELAAARSSRAKDKHWQASVADPGDLSGADLADTVRKAVAETAAVLLGQAELPGIPSRVMRNFGVAGMRTWAERLRDTRTKKGWTGMFATEDRLRPALLQLAGFLSGNEWAGPGGLRPLYAQFLRDASAGVGPAGFGEAADRYDELGKDWTGLANLIDPACPLDARSDHFAALADQLDRLASAEQTAAESLQAALG